MGFNARQFFCGMVLVATVAMPNNVPAAPIESETGAPVSQISPSAIQITGQLSPELKKAVTQISGGSYDEAITAAKRVTDNPGEESGRAQAYEVLGIAQYLKGDTDGAIASFKHAVAINPAQGSAFTRLGSIALGGNRLGEAAGYYRQALSVEPADVLARRRLAGVLRHQGDIESATREYEELLKLTQPGQAVDRIALAMLYNQQQRYGDAIRLLTPIVDTRSTNSTALLALGTAYLGSGDSKSAMSLLTAAKTLDPKNTAVSLALGMAQREAGQLDASLESLKQAATALPAFVPAHYQLGLTYLALSKYGEAQDAFETAHRLSPEAGEVQAALGEALLLGGRPEEAFSAFATLTRRQTARLSDFVALATAYQATGRIADAERTYRDAANRFPQDPEAWWRLGATLAFERKYGEASKALASGIAIAPDDPRLLRDAAVVEARLGNYPAALALGDRLTTKDPKSAATRFLVAGLYQDSGDKKRAAELYRAILADQPDYPWALNNLAALLTESGEPGSAVTLAKRAAELLPDSAVIADTLGWSFLKGGEMKAAVQMLEKARSLAPSDPEILYRLAVAQKAAGDGAAARTNARQALALSSDFKDVEGARALLSELPSEPPPNSGKSP